MKLKKFSLLFSVTFSLFSCSTDNEVLTIQNETKNNKIIDGIPFDPDTYITKDVYISGRYNNNFSSEWINGIQNNLTGYNNITRANGNYVTNTGDVYTAGTYDGSPVYWKNGILNILPCTSGIYGEAKSIFVLNGDVYAAGYMNILENGQFTYYATIWINGVPTKLSNYQSEANSIYVYGTTTYVCGYDTTSSSSTRKPALWKNTILSFLPTTATYDCEATGVFYYGGSVFVSGYGKKIWNGGATAEERYYKARYWRQNAEYILADDNLRDNKANAIYVDTGAIYVAGVDIIDNASNGNNNGINIMRAKYWRNRTAPPVLLNDGVSTRAEATSIIAKGNKVLISGWSATSNDLNTSEAVYWDDSNINYLTNNSTGLSRANSIYATFILE